jgi:Phosphotransferase enzyme family
VVEAVAERQPYAMPGAEINDLSQLNAGFQVLAGGESQRLCLARDDTRTVGSVVERYAAVPSLADPRALLPLEATPSALRAVLSQHIAGAASPLARGAARLLYLASHIGLARPLLRHRVSLIAPDHNFTEAPLHMFLSDILARRDFVTGLRLAPGRPNSKPVVQVVAHDGSILAYAKFGWEPLTCRLIRHEAAMLQELAPRIRGSALQVPKVIYNGKWQDLEALILAPLDSMGRTPHRASNVPVAASLALAEVRGQTIERLGRSAFWQRLRTRIEQLGTFLPEQNRRLVFQARDQVEGRWGDTLLPTGQSHGDWIPPNMVIRSDGTYSVWDWERSATDTPLGIDTMQFLVFLALKQRRSSWEAGGRFAQMARTALIRQRLDPNHSALLAILSLLQTLLWYAEAREAGRETDKAGREERDAGRFAHTLAVMLEQR